MSSSQLNNLKSGIKCGAKVTLNLSSKEIIDSNDDTNLPNELLLTNTKVLRIGTANGLSSKIIFSKTNLSKMVELGNF